MSERLNKLFQTYAYNPQQKNQLRIADEKKLDIDKIKNPSYDWEQMREIALCMEYEVDPTPLCDPEIPSESMEDIRSHLFENQGVFLAAKEKIYNRRTKRLIISFVSLFVILSVICLGFWKKEFILSFFDSLELVLIDKRVDVGLSQVEAIKYIDYVKSYNDNMELILPDQEIDSIGEYMLHYQLKNESKVVKKDLILVVYDDVKPSIELTKTSVTIKYESSFNSKSYLKSVTDNIDGDLINQVSIYNDDFSTNSPGTYKVKYSVKDKMGNESITALNVVVEKKETSLGSTENGLSSPGTQKPSGESSSSGPLGGSSFKPASKSFTIDTYSSFDECLKASNNYINECINKGYQGRADSQPIKKDGVYVGYEAIFGKKGQ